ncbi:Cj0814 family flagellar-dependent secreted protein, partial [Campylobacter troglodytis]|uniref:Cj0814 family flagellar-dependent secreted protein n=1 Tax=Campylobacter troglodytis TaxID=654363 RepID=UPI00163CCF99
KLSVREKTNSNAVNSNSKISNSANEVLGYKVDKEGYFTEEFNKAAGIPKDYKIHSSTMESLVRAKTQTLVPFYRFFTSVDIAKSIGNAYKILSQVVGDEVLNSKNDFTSDDIKSLQKAFTYNTKTLELMQTESLNRFENVEVKDMGLKENEAFSSLFIDTDEPLNGKENLNVGSFSTTANKYTNKDGSISKGGLLIGVLNSNLHAIEGETTIWGKMQGYDKNADSKALRKWFNDEQFQTFPFGDENFMPLMLETDLDEFMSKYAKYKEKRLKELEENSFSIEDMIREMKKYIELIFGKSDELRKELEEEQKKLFTNEIRLDIKA